MNRGRDESHNPHFLLLPVKIIQTNFALNLIVMLYLSINNQFYEAKEEVI